MLIESNLAYKTQTNNTEVNTMDVYNQLTNVSENSEKNFMTEFYFP